MRVWFKMKHGCPYFNYFLYWFSEVETSCKLFCLSFIFFSQIYTFLWNGEALDLLKTVSLKIKFNISWRTSVNLIIWILLGILSSFNLLNTIVNTILKYYCRQALNKEPKLIGVMKCFTKKLLGHEIYSSMVPWATKYLL